MSDQIPSEFNWSMYEGGYNGSTKLIPNKSINGSNDKNKCFSREPYAQELFDVYTNQDSNLIKKDLNVGDVVRITDIFNIKDTFIDVELSGGLTVTIDLTREKKFVQVFGYNNVKQFIDSLRDKIILKNFLDRGLNAYILEATPSIKISLWQGHLKSVRDEFMSQIENPTQAYTAKIVEANKGGFFVEVQGIEAFMPGSLAAPNKIADFQSYVGKEVIVMIEDFLKEMNSFIVSHKKYLAHVLPIKIKELDVNKKYSGLVTGCSKYGIFVEFEELFTGLLHTSKMDTETKMLFNQRTIKSGDIIEFYISEITKDNRIILTKESPEEKLNKIQNFIVNSKDKVLESSVAAVMNFGIIVNIENLSGLIPLKELKKHKIMANNFVSGDKINVLFAEYKDERIVFKLPLIE
jgi:predicted RNA-binding protein with RPS1 domain